MKFTAVLPEISNKQKEREQMFVRRMHVKYGTSIQRNSIRLLKLDKFVVFQDTIIKYKMQDTEQE